MRAETKIRKRRKTKRNGRVERLMARVRRRRDKQIAWLLIFSSEHAPEKKKTQRAKTAR